MFSYSIQNVEHNHLLSQAKNIKTYNLILTLLKILLLNITLTQLNSKLLINCQGVKLCCAQISIENDRCTSCPSGTHLYLGNCIDDLEHCQAYTNGFDCQLCQLGYIVMSQSQEDDSLVCKNQTFFNLVSTQIYKQLRPGQDKQEPNSFVFERIKKNLQSSKRGLQLPSYIFAARANNTIKRSTIVNGNQKLYYNYIFDLSTQYIEVYVIYDPLTKELSSTYLNVYNVPALKFKVEPFLKDPLFNQIQQNLTLKYSRRGKITIVALFKQNLEQNKNYNITKYIVYSILSNVGLQQDIIQLNITNQQIIPPPQNTTKQQILQDPYLSTAIQELKKNPNVSQYLKGTQIQKGQKIYINKTTTAYNITFIHPDIQIDGNNNPRSILRFYKISTNGIITTKMINSYFYRKQAVTIEVPELNKTDVESLINQVPPFKFQVSVLPNNQAIIPQNMEQKLLNLSNIRASIPKSVEGASPTLNRISSDVKFQQLINTDLIPSTPIFQDIRNFLSQYYSPLSSLSLNSDFTRVSIGQNETNIFYEIGIRKYDIKNNQYYFTFSVDKETKNLSLVFGVSIPNDNRKHLDLNKQNRGLILKNLDNNTKSAIQQVSKNPLFNNYSQIYQITQIRFNEKQNNNNMTIQIIRYEIKYYYPLITKSPYQFIDFRVELVPSNGTKRSLSVITFPREYFTPYDFSVEDMNIRKIKEILIINLLAPGQTNFTYENIYLSTVQKNLFRVEINVADKYSLITQINLDKPNYPKILSNISIPKQKPAPDFVMGTAYVLISTSKNTNRIQGLQVPIFPRNPNQPQKLTSALAKQYVSSYFNIPLSSIASTQIMRYKGQKQKPIDTYGVVYNEYKSGNPNQVGQNTWFFFQINKTDILKPR